MYSAAHPIDMLTSENWNSAVIYTTHSDTELLLNLTFRIDVLGRCKGRWFAWGY